MKIVTAHADIYGIPCDIYEGVRMLREVEHITRLSHRSEDLETNNSWEKLIRTVVIQHGDLSVIEHKSVTVLVRCDRGISHEWVRHRIGAYTQESTRFVNYKKKFGEIEFIQPPNLSEYRAEQWKSAMQEAERVYFQLVSDGTSVTDPNDIEKPLAPQLARSVLPNGLVTRLYATYNLRMWRHFFLMRTTQETHPQMKEITIPLLKQFQERIPILYEDIEPNLKQSESMKKLR